MFISTFAFDRTWRNLKSILFNVLLIVSLLFAQKMKASEPKTYRHHVIFLVDSSGSVYSGANSIGSKADLQNALKAKLQDILLDGNKNGFGISIYDPAYDPDKKGDLSSAFAFGLSKQYPLLSARNPENNQDFFRTIWCLEQGNTVDTLAAMLPEGGRNWTAFNAAFELAVQKIRYQIQNTSYDIAKPAFDRTFLVMISDGKSNKTQDGMDELKEIFGAVRDRHQNPDSWRIAMKYGDHDFQSVLSDRQRLMEYYSFRYPPNLDPEECVSGIPMDYRIEFYDGRRKTLHYKVFIRELVPHRMDGVDSLLSTRPDTQTELKRRANNRYSGRIRLAPNGISPGNDRSYEWVEFTFKGPLDLYPRSIKPVPVPGQPFEETVALSKDAVDSGRAEFAIKAVRRDPVYGMTIQEFPGSFGFRREQDQMFWFWPLPAYLMDLHPDMDQKQVFYLYNYTSFGILALLLILFLAWLLYPRPRAQQQWISPFQSGEKKAVPIPIDFNKRVTGDQRTYPLALGTLQFTNIARRRIFWIPFPIRIPGRVFNIDAAVSLDKIKGMKVDPYIPEIGYFADMTATKCLKKLSHHSQITLGFNPDSVLDYTNADWSKPVRGIIRIFGIQFYRPFYLLWFRHNRPLIPIKESLYLQFIPENSSVNISVKRGVDDHYTGETKSRPLPQLSNIDAFMVRPHWRGRHTAEEPAEPEFYVEVSSAAAHLCSLSRNARLEVTMYPLVDRNRRFEAPIQLAVPEAGSMYPEMTLATSANGDQFMKLIGISKRHEPVRVPIRLNYDQLPAPPQNGADYIVEAQIYPEDGQTWPSMAVRYGLRLGPDFREAGLLFSCSALSAARSSSDSWSAFDAKIHGDSYDIAIDQSVAWSIGTEKTEMGFLKLKVDNLARSGTGQVQLKLMPDIIVKYDGDPFSEPDYKNNNIKRILIFEDGSSVATPRKNVADINKPIIWDIPNEASGANRPRKINLIFNPYGITQIQPECRLHRFQCRLPFQYTVRKTRDQTPENHSFVLNIQFDVERYTGDFVLGVDFGTSAVVAAFEQTLHNIHTRHSDDYSVATLNLQDRFQEMLTQGDRDNLDGWKILYNDEMTVPNPENKTPFIPSYLYLRDEQRIGSPDFIYLPASYGRIAHRPDRAVYYLKSLLLSGETYLPPLSRAGEKREPLKWLDDDSVDELEDTAYQTGPIQVDWIMQSAYNNLMDNYILPILNKSGQNTMMDKMVIAHPNNFSLGHMERLDGIFKDTFHDKYRYNLLSESNAVAIYCASQPKRFFKQSIEEKSQQHILVYDIGAGTLDITYTQMTWAGQEEACALKKMRVLFKYGRSVAGNKLDECYARVIDSKIRDMVSKLNQDGASIEYVNPIVDPVNVDPELYCARNYNLKRFIHYMKQKVTDFHRKEPGSPFRIFIPVNRSANLVDRMIYDDDPGKSAALLKKYGIKSTRKKGREGVEDEIYKIPLRSTEIFTHPEIDGWLTSVTDEVFQDMAGALRKMGQDIQIDSLILSGRTAQFPPLRPRLMNALRTYLGVDPEILHIPDISEHESKEAVALGCLHYGLQLREGLDFFDRNIWAKYGLIYNTGTGEKFQSFFGYDTPIEPGDLEVKKDGLTVILFKRRKTIIRAGGTIQVAVTFSHDPEKDIPDPVKRKEKFQVIRNLGSNVLRGLGNRVTVEMSIDKDNRLRVVVDPDGHKRMPPVMEFQPEGSIPQREWPFQPLTTGWTSCKEDVQGDAGEVQGETLSEPVESGREPRPEKTEQASQPPPPPPAEKRAHSVKKAAASPVKTLISPVKSLATLEDLIDEDVD